MIPDNGWEEDSAEKEAGLFLENPLTIHTSRKKLTW
jgi:hypothetical protein